MAFHLNLKGIYNKVLGFHEPALARYLKDSFVYTSAYDHNSTVDFVSAPTWEQVRRWFRTVHNMNLEIYQAAQDEAKHLNEISSHTFEATQIL